ncbi:hypothetical protein NEMBOFW57_000375 [Staphylotrichum longicolle]|uniref:Uncharacterized protein n=1 Tax=Staphylotrichum longicolle TaxID=669026 RepID=A0AAD4F0B3_9PEZI|nr:hypothetical protein NEMBOFW57_000375 [Staphylotrichum longicolle]
MTDSPRQPAAAPTLEAELTCSICTDLLYQPLTLLDCLHTFCAACLKEWFAFQAARIDASPPRPAAGHPDLHGKSAEERREMDGRYTKGEGVMPKVKKMEGRTEEERGRTRRERLIEEGMEARDIEKEIEEFARQIQEEGLLDGLDLDNLDLENNDELSRRITEAYRRRHRERRRDGGRRSNASAHSHRSDVSGRPRSRTDDSSRPTSRHTARSRAPSAGGSGGEERGRYPPSSSAHLEVQEPSRRRRTASSSRSATLPVVPTQPDLPRYKEPLIHCSTCSKEHIEYELHFNCSICHGGEWNICLDCWRRRKGCLHWFGFGAAAWSRWEKHNLHHPPTAPPHMLTANRYLPPKTIPGGAEGRRVLTTENPLDRLQSGTFCCSCSAWTNSCYWRCDVCNDGEWGFCTDCVNQEENDAIPKQGGYNLCSPCFASFIASGSIAPRTGPRGGGGVPHGGGNGYLRRVVLRDLVGGRRLRFEDWRPREQVCWWREDGGSGRRVERLFAADVRVVTNPAGGGGEGAAGRWTRTFPPDGGSGWRAVAGWGWVPGPGGEDELMFPKGAEVLEVEDVNGEWFHGFYMGQQGLFPAPYVRVVSR